MDPSNLFKGRQTVESVQALCSKKKEKKPLDNERKVDSSVDSVRLRRPFFPKVLWSVSCFFYYLFAFVSFGVFFFFERELGKFLLNRSSQFIFEFRFAYTIEVHRKWIMFNMHRPAHRSPFDAVVRTDRHHFILDYVLTLVFFFDLHTNCTSHKTLTNSLILCSFRRFFFIIICFCFLFF
jgi:hypothetical protein